MVIPPPSKKLRKEVDLSYVNPSEGTMFISNGDDEHDVDGEASISSSSLVSPESTSGETKENNCTITQCHDHALSLDTDEGHVTPRRYACKSGATQTVILKRQDSMGSTTTANQQPFFDFKTETTRFSDIIGHSDAKLRIDEILLPLALPSSLTDSVLRGIRSHPASILLFGPPGTGKTMLARAIAGESNAAFLSIGPSDVLSKFVGESEASLRKLFQQARLIATRIESRCAVIFFDEIDALGYSRGLGDEGGMHSSQDGDGSRRILAELLIQLSNLSSGNEQAPLNLEDSREEFDSTSVSDVEQSDRVRVIVVAATNRLADCDPALVRRFAIQIHVGLPQARDRRNIVVKFLSDLEHSLTKKDLKELADATEGWSGSDLESLTREAAMAPVRECLQAAAATKRRARKLEQQGGLASAQETVKAQDAFKAAKEALFMEFQNLRPIAIEDFHAGLNFLMCTSQGEPLKRTYDSSTDSEDEDD
jgi:SpoVK/Ycf46/Vps4 family AAA+-type ATPase